MLGRLRLSTNAILPFPKPPKADGAFQFIVTLRDLDLRYTLPALIALRYCFCFPTLATDVCGNLREIVSAPVLLCARSELAKEIPTCDPTPHPSQHGTHPAALLLLIRRLEESL
ncbi:hypothetical protein CKAH01_00617 [Colletotrichum kahawae]|uniref:Uncharacterized protein n=1 Tax=Colletotrichum kahawae TaxID=34407 RepID=A0AAD9YLN7_COLKA|nr:hypothetical protein CKAH01_00617 [Colletotrichum kahawae]